MLTNKKVLIAAIATMAVMFFCIGLTGCATKRNIDEVKAEVRDVKRQNEDTQQLLARMDSTLASGAEANNRMRADVSTTIDHMQQQIDMLLENYNDLLAQVRQLSRQPSVTHVVRSSPGSQEQSSVTVQPEEAPQPSAPESEPQIDCGQVYDESFILVRRGEYENAIEGFRNFLQNCARHESAENAHYWIGESYYSMEKYVDAITEFQYLINNFKESVNASRALYKLARSQQELGRKNEAKTTFQKLIDDYPETLEASQARERLKDL